MELDTALTIADAARATGVSAHTLSYYERAGWIDGVGRADSGHRRYNGVALLEEHRDAVTAHLEEVRRHLAFIERKIETYEEKING